MIYAFAGLGVVYLLKQVRRCWKWLTTDRGQGSLLDEDWFWW